MKNYVNWFEIPTENFNRAVEFYSSIYQVGLDTTELGGKPAAVLPADKGISGTITQSNGNKPGPNGPVIYLNGGRKLDKILARVEPSGGRVLQPKTLLNKAVGYYALFEDSEGNRIGLHSRT